MDCNRIQDKLSDYIDRLLDDNEEMEVRRHLAECPDCRRELTGLKRTVGLMRGMPRVNAPPNFMRALEEKLAEQRTPWWKKALAGLDRGLSALPLRTMTAAATFVLAVTFFLVVGGEVGHEPGNNGAHVMAMTHDPDVLSSETSLLPVEFASTNPAGEDAPPHRDISFNTATEFLTKIVSEDRAYAGAKIYPHPRGNGIVISTPDRVVEAWMNQEEFLIIQSQIEWNNAVMPRTLREARVRYPVYVRSLPSPTAPIE